MKLFKMFIIALFVSCLGIAALDAQIQGVKGTVYIIDGNKNKSVKLTVQPHDTIVIEWTYPISPPFPKTASQKSSDEAVAKGVGVHRVQHVKGPIGVGKLGAVFMAEKTGTSTLTFDVSHGKDDIKMTCELEVKEAKKK